MLIRRPNSDPILARKKWISRKNALSDIWGVIWTDDRAPGVGVDRHSCLIALRESFKSIKSPQPTIWHDLGFLTIGCHFSPKRWAKIQILHQSFYTVMSHESWDDIGNKLIRGEIFFSKRFCLVFLFSWPLWNPNIRNFAVLKKYIPL